MLISEVRDDASAARYLAEKLGTKTDWLPILFAWVKKRGAPAFFETEKLPELVSRLQWAAVEFVVEHSEQPTAPRPVLDVVRAIADEFQLQEKNGFPVVLRRLATVIVQALRESAIAQHGAGAAVATIDATGEFSAGVPVRDVLQWMCAAASERAALSGRFWSCVCGTHAASGDGWQPGLVPGHNSETFVREMCDDIASVPGGAPVDQYRPGD